MPQAIAAQGRTIALLHGQCRRGLLPYKFLVLLAEEAEEVELSLPWVVGVEAGLAPLFKME
jgi:hypothetical protein